MDRENGKHPAGGTPKKSRPKKPKKPSRLTRQQKLLIAVAVVLAIVLIAVVACQSLFVRPDLPEKNADADSGTQEEEIDWGEGTRPRSDGERKSQDYYTVLILGRDTGGRRQHGHDAAGQLRRDQPEGHGDVYSPGYHGECLLGYQAHQLRV